MAALPAISPLTADPATALVLDSKEGADHLILKVHESLQLLYVVEDAWVN